VNGVDEFHWVVGQVFAALYRRLPEPQDLEPIGEAPETFRNAVHWLRSEGFLGYREEAPAGFKAAALAPKGVEALAQVPEGWNGSIGAELADAAAAGADGRLVGAVKVAYGIHMRDVLGKVVLGVLFDHWTCGKRGGEEGSQLGQLGCDSGCRC
jgi:hypothetical protein